MSEINKVNSDTIERKIDNVFFIRISPLIFVLNYSK